MAGSKGVWKPKTSKFYYCRFEVGGKLFRGSTKLTNHTDALRYAKEWKRREVRKHEDLGPSNGRHLVLLAAANRFVDEFEGSQDQLRKIEPRIDWLVDQIGADTRLADIDDDMVARLCTTRLTMFRQGKPCLGKVKNSTVNTNVVELLSRIMGRARKKWKVPMPHYPDFGAHRLQTTARTREMSIPEEIAVMAVAGDCAEPLEFAVLSGLRREEILIRWSQVHWEEEVIRVQVKGNKTHEVLITPRIRQILEANWGRHDEFVFTVRDELVVTGGALPPRPAGKGGRPINARSLFECFKRIQKRAGVKGLTLHDLRRTAGARKYRATGDLALVAKFLGHANIETTRRHYVHIRLDDIRVRLIAAEEHYETLKREALKRLAA